MEEADDSELPLGRLWIEDAGDDPADEICEDATNGDGDVAHELVLVVTATESLMVVLVPVAEVVMMEVVLWVVGEYLTSCDSDPVPADVAEGGFDNMDPTPLVLEESELEQAPPGGLGFFFRVSFRSPRFAGDGVMVVSVKLAVVNFPVKLPVVGLLLAPLLVLGLGVVAVDAGVRGAGYSGDAEMEGVSDALLELLSFLSRSSSFSLSRSSSRCRSRCNSSRSSRSCSSFSLWSFSLCSLSLSTANAEGLPGLISLSLLVSFSRSR